MEKIKNELKLLEQFERECPINWSVDFWKLTDETEQEFEKLLKQCKGSDINEIFPNDFYNEMMRQIKHFNEHGVRVDGTTPWLVKYFGSIEKTMEWAINA